MSDEQQVRDSDRIMREAGLGLLGSEESGQRVGELDAMWGTIEALDRRVAQLGRQNRQLFGICVILFVGLVCAVCGLEWRLM